MYGMSRHESRSAKHAGCEHTSKPGRPAAQRSMSMEAAGISAPIWRSVPSSASRATPRRAISASTCIGSSRHQARLRRLIMQVPAEAAPVLAPL